MKMNVVERAPSEKTKSCLLIGKASYPKADGVVIIEDTSLVCLADREVFERLCAKASGAVLRHTTEHKTDHG